MELPNDLFASYPAFLNNYGASLTCSMPPFYFAIRWNAFIQYSTKSMQLYLTWSVSDINMVLKILDHSFMNHQEGSGMPPYYILPPFLNISHIVFSTNINVRLREGYETEKKKENQTIFPLPIRLLPKSKGLAGACAMYGGKVSKLIGVGSDTYLYFRIFFRNLYGLY